MSESKTSESAFRAPGTIAVAESLTGGLLASSFVDIPGSSAYFKGGMITYSLESKVDLIGSRYSDEIYECNGVSLKVAKLMATSISELFETDYGIATTGYAQAGPDQAQMAHIAIYRRTDGKYASTSTQIVRPSSQYSRNDFRYLVVNLARRLLDDFDSETVD